MPRSRITAYRADFELGARSERIARARFDGDQLSLPDTLDTFSDRELNEQLYFWLVAWIAVGGDDIPALPQDPLARDIARIAHAKRTSARVLAWFPGLKRHYRILSAETLRLRASLPLPPDEANIERMIRNVISAEGRSNGVLIQTVRRFPAMTEYRTYLPVPLWGEIDVPGRRECRPEFDADPGSAKAAGGDGKSRRAKRRTSDQIGRKEGLLVHRFEKILTWTEFMNLHRDVEDDDEQSARKAADDHDDIGIGQHLRKTVTRLKIDLDLSPSDVDAEELSVPVTYPEWDYRRQAYHPNHVRVLERVGDASVPGTGWQPSSKTERRIRAVRRQFEALRPKREVFGRQLDGHEIDMDALIRSQTDLKARGEGSDRIFRQARDQARDLSVTVLIDVSRSTESFVDDRAVIDIEREALVALAEGLDACGDEAAIFAFSSLRRDRVYVTKLKDFSETSCAMVRARISGLQPGFYTRLGAAIRHTSAALAKRPTRKRLLLVLTDGKPNDLDHYEGRYGVEDTRKAIQEARRAGHAVFGITIDRKAESYVARMFGAGGFAIVSRPSQLTAALPILYRHLVA